MLYVKSRGIIVLSRMRHNVKTTWGGGAWGEFNDQIEPIVLSQLSSKPISRYIHIRCKNNQYFFSFNLKYKKQ